MRGRATGRVRTAPTAAGVGARICHPRLADLARVFPGLLFALAVPRRDPKTAIDLAIFGAPAQGRRGGCRHASLASPAAAEAFAAPLPQLPDSPELRCRLANHVPRHRKLASDWLRSVADAVDVCDAELAVWIARELAAPVPTRKWKGRLCLLALYVWYLRGVGTAAGPSSLASSTAILRAAVHLRGIAEEAQEMQNCLVTCGSDVAEDQQRFWSIRRDGARGATLGLYVRPDWQILEIYEFRARSNKVAPREVWRAARVWLDQDVATVVTARERVIAARSQGVDRALAAVLAGEGPFPGLAAAHADPPGARGPLGSSSEVNAASVPG